MVGFFFLIMLVLKVMLTDATVSDCTVMWDSAPHSWIPPLKWDPNVSCCSWSGVICNADMRVTRISIFHGSIDPPYMLTSFEPLGGTLPSAWQYLTELERIVLAGTGIGGTLPKEWGNGGLSKIVELNLIVNAFTGFLPPEWGNLTEVEVIDVSGNMLAGTIPASWSTFPKLKILGLGRNKLSGTLPSVLPQSLTNLILYDNMFYGTLPAGWSSLKLIQVLDAGELPLLSGTLPPEWASLNESLEQLDMPGNLGIGGELPPEWNALIKLTQIDVSRNSLSGTLPTCWQSLKQLTTFSVGSNNFVGPLPCEWIDNLRNLQVLDVSSNQLNGTVCEDSIANSSSLALLVVSNNRFELPLKLFEHRNLSKLCLLMSGNMLSGQLPSVLHGPAACLVLSRNNFTGTAPRQTGSLLVDLSSNSLSGTLPCMTSNLSTVSLRFDNNELVSLADETTSCSMPWLTSLTAAGCPLDSLPQQIDILFPSLQVFSAANCKVQNGSTPNFPKNQMQILDLSGNDFSGGSTPIARVMSSTAAQYINVAPYKNPVSISLHPGDVCAQENPLCLMVLDMCSAINTTTQATSYGKISQCIVGNLLVFLSHRDNMSMTFDFWYLANYAETIWVPAEIIATPWSFIQYGLSGYYRALLIPLDLPVSVEQPEPGWNNSISVLQPMLSGQLKFTGLASAVLLNNVTYKLVVRITALDRNTICGKIQFSFAENFSPSNCQSTLYAVPYTTSCVACPVHSSCNGSSQLIAALSWRPSASLLPLYPCDAGSGGCAESSSGTTCASGYTGTLCSVCAAGFGNSFGSCVTCWTQWVNYLSTIVGGIAGLMVITFAVVKSMAPPPEVPTTVRSVVVSCVTTSISLLSNHFSLNAPLVSTKVFAYLHPIAQKTVHAQASCGSIPLARLNAIGCLFPNFDAVGQLGFLLLALPSIILVEALLVKYVLRAGGKIAATVCVSHLLYMSVISHAALLFQYDTYQFYDITEYLTQPSMALGISVATSLEITSLHTDRRIQFEDNSGGIILAVVALVVVGCGAPAAFVFAFQNRAAEQQKKFLYLTKKYTSQCWYWECVIASRKALTVIFTAGLFRYAVPQLQIYILVLVAYVALHEKQAPSQSISKLLREFHAQVQ